MCAKMNTVNVVNLVLGLGTLVALVNGSDQVLVVENNDAFSTMVEQAVQSREANSTICGQHLLYYLSHLKEKWAARMLDSSSKVPVGLLMGNIADLGQFDECLAVEHSINNIPIRGKYCKVSIPISKFITTTEPSKSLINPPYAIQPRGVVNLNSATPMLTLAACVPSSCDAPTLNAMLKSSIIGRILGFTIVNCQSNDDESDKLSGGDWAALAFFITMGAILMLSTGYDLTQRFLKKKPAHILLVAFSVYTNGQKLLTTTKNPEQLPCLNGVRFISMMWVIIGHTYYSSFFSPSLNSLQALEWMEKPSSMYVLGATVSVDSFFVLGGLLMAYVYLGAMKKGIKFNIILYYVHRYIRLTPSLAVAIVLHITLLRFISSGPNWPEVLKYLETNCTKYWWSALLYVQNYVNPHEMCIGQTWYLSVDMQIFIVSPLILIPLGKWPKKTMYFLGLLVLVSVASPFYVGYINKMPALLSQSFSDPHLNENYYYNTLTRFGPVVVGIMLGYFVFHRKQNKKLNKMFSNMYLNGIGWLLSVGILVTILFAPTNMYHHTYNRIEASIFIGFHRVVWAIALSWIIYACIVGHGGIVNAFLSLPAFQVLGRLTYSMYLIHLSFQTMKIGYIRTPVHFSNLENMYFFWGDFIFTAAISTCWTLAFESPILIIEKVIFGTSKKPVAKAPNRTIAET